MPTLTCTIETHRVPMRDGVPLHTVVCRPPGAGPFPALLTRTAYSAKTGALPPPAEDLLAAGTAAVVQDCRGTGRSAGVFYPWHPEADDGADCLAWVAAQPWCNGRIAMRGGSYSGMTQWLAAGSSHPALVALAPHVSPWDCHQSPQYTSGAFGLQISLQWGLANHYRNGGYPELKFDWERLLRHLPLAGVPAAAGLRPIPFWQDWLAHPDDGPFWEAVDASRAVERIRAPALISGGWFDPYARSSLDAFTAMRARAGSDRARAFTRCVIGPWTHGGPAGALLDCGEQASTDALQRARDRFLANSLRDPHADPLPGEPPLRYFLMGLNEWRAADAWPPPGAQPRALFLRGGGAANSRFGDGALDPAPPGREPPDVFLYDPRQPVPTNGGCSLYPPAGVCDQAALEDRADILVYTGAPLAADLAVAGPVSLVLYAASSAPDTDVTAKLVDVYPDGRALNVCDGILRARYRNGRSRPEPLVPGTPSRLAIDLWDTAHCFRAGHRLRLEVSSSNFPRFDRNPNTGRPAESVADLRVARQTILHDAEHPSRLVLPVL